MHLCQMWANYNLKFQSLQGCHDACLTLYGRESRAKTLNQILIRVEFILNQATQKNNVIVGPCRTHVRYYIQDMLEYEIRPIGYQFAYYI